MFAGRLTGEKGIAVLIRAWRASGLHAPAAALVLVGEGRFRAPPLATGAVLRVGAMAPAQVRNFYAGSDVVVLPSIPTRDFREPWGLVANEAFHQGVPVIATDAVGAAAGGLIENERNGLVVPPGMPTRSPSLCAGCTTTVNLVRASARRAAPTSPPTRRPHGRAGMTRALAAAGVSRSHHERGDH